MTSFWNQCDSYGLIFLKKQEDRSRTAIALPGAEKKPNKSRRPDGAYVPPAVVANLASWTAHPLKLFNIDEHSFDLLDDPVVGITTYLDGLGGHNEDDMKKIRVRFMKIFYYKLNQLGYLSKPRKTDKERIASKSGLFAKDISSSTAEGRRLHALCYDIGKVQQEIDNAHLGNLFALPGYVSDN